MNKYENMTVFAHFKYSENKPVLHVHIWDIFDNANQDTENFDTFFDNIYEKLKVEHSKLGIEESIEELAMNNSFSTENNVRSEMNDSAHEELMAAINKNTKYNLLTDQSD